jgi:hypothetical protein
MLDDDVGVRAVGAVAELAAHEPSRLAVITTAAASVARRGRALTWVVVPPADAVADFGRSRSSPIEALWS